MIDKYDNVFLFSESSIVVIVISSRSWGTGVGAASEDMKPSPQSHE